MGQGDLFDNESLVKAIKQVDVVISTLGGHMVPHQHKVLSAIKQAGNVKVTFIFLPILFNILPTTMSLVVVALMQDSFS